MNSRWLRARASAKAMAARRMDYTVTNVSDIGEGDGVRLVPGEGNPVPVHLCQPLVVIGVSQMMTLVAVSLRPRAAMVREHIAGITTDYSPGSDFVELVIYDKDYPILLRG